MSGIRRLLSAHVPNTVSPSQAAAIFSASESQKLLYSFWRICLMLRAKIREWFYPTTHPDSRHLLHSLPEGLKDHKHEIKDFVAHGSN
jgi:hypothetical protein